jgi:cobalt-zinc-cadmium resistance protein CzcA
MFLLLFVALNSMAHAGVILTSLPDAFVGGIAALLLFHETLNVSSAVGFIALFGIAVQNGLVLVTQANDLRAQGVGMEEAILQASINRLRPKLMTASCAIFGLLPILLLPGSGIEIERPLAIVMIGGLLMSTLFTLLVLPTVYVMVERWRQACHPNETLGNA